jgi:hypothetical protein
MPVKKNVPYPPTATVSPLPASQIAKSGPKLKRSSMSEEESAHPHGDYPIPPTPSPPATPPPSPPHFAHPHPCCSQPLLHLSQPAFNPSLHGYTRGRATGFLRFIKAEKQQDGRKEPRSQNGNPAAVRRLSYREALLSPWPPSGKESPAQEELLKR